MDCGNPGVYRNFTQQEAEFWGGNVQKIFRTPKVKLRYIFKFRTKQNSAKKSITVRGIFEKDS